MSPAAIMWEHHSWESPIRVGGRAFAARFLDEGWSVAWLNGPLAPWNLAGGNDEVRRRRACWRQGGVRLRAGSGRLFAYAPLSPFAYRRHPLLDRRWLHRHALSLTVPGLMRRLEGEGFGRIDLLWLATGSPLLPLLEKVKFDLSLYRVSDHAAAFPDTPRSYAKIEEEALRRVDRVVATALSLAERASRFNSRVLLLPNGVDLRRFPILPKRMWPAPAARIIYLGAIDSWFDTAAVAALARGLPEAEIVLAGPNRLGRSWAKELPAVKFQGPVSAEEVPRILGESDLGIIPFRDTALTRAIHPVKLYEYFAAGIPVVAADLEEIRRIASPALLARNGSEWVDAARSALAGGRRSEYRAFAERHDWGTRYAELMAFLGRPAALSGRRAREGAS
ncbi:MAG TPA: glycosyltransferase [Candidatus Polarisedimenticolia bacterium]|nr:glycosyltransferase [Candidatus Polarisedimenticolia bacterium]